MQDREFDDVFRNKLDGFETEPSAKVWMGIDATLDEKSRKKAIMPWLSIAASVIVLVSAGILFIPKKTIPQHNNRIVKVRPAQNIARPKQETAIKTPALQTEIAVTPVATKPLIHHTKEIGKVVAPVEKPTEMIAQTAPAKTNEQPVLAALPQKQQQTTQPVVPGNETPLTIKQTDYNNVPEQIKPALIAQQLTPVNKPAVTASPKKHGIRNFGDLVNLVVAKVDKRKDKGLEFSGDDDDESVIAEVNKGIQRIKKDRAQEDDK